MDISQRLQNLSPAKRALLLKRLKQQQTDAPASSTQGQAMTVAQLQAEATLEPEICPQRLEFSGDLAAAPKTILLTGATGFIGAFLLEELLRTTSAEVYCLVRAETAAAGKQRLQKNLETYHLWHEALGDRIIPVVGDLTQPRLGLSESEFTALARQLDALYHCGAVVKWTYPYSTLKAANVLGTKTMIRLACLEKVKPLHFISTVGVFSSPHFNAEVVREDDPLESSGPLYGGYAQTKWVAEKLVAIAGSRGLPVTIYRPNTEGHSQTGAFNRQDHLVLITKGCIQMGCAPQEMNLIVASAPIDYAARAIVYLSGQPQSRGQVFHITNPQPIRWGEWIDLVIAQGYPLEKLPYREWVAELKRQIQTTRNNELYALSPIFSDSLLESAQIPTFDCSRTLAGLAGTGIDCPAIDANLVQVYFSYFVDSGFLPPPPQQVGAGSGTVSSAN